MEKVEPAPEMENLGLNAEKFLILGRKISAEGIEPDEDSRTAVSEWRTPRSLKEMQSFPGFANFY